MTNEKVAEVLERVYESLRNDNQDIDLVIADLKKAMSAEGSKDVKVDAEKLVQNNRQGRKMMQSYFKKRGVKVIFE